MSYKIIKPTFLAHGKHDNLHLIVRIGGSKRHSLFSFKLVHFFSTEKCYILNSNISINIKPFLNYDIIERVIRETVGTLDYNLELFDKNDFFNKGLTTQHILNKLINKN